MKLREHFTTAFIREFTDWQLWRSRAVVIAFAALAGAIIVTFTWLAEHALALFFNLQHFRWWAPLLWTPLCTGIIVWLTRRYAQGAAGSGIPQVMAALDSGIIPTQHRYFVSPFLSIAKIMLTAWGLLAGLSLGREGPSVQIAAGVMLMSQKLLPKRKIITAHGLLVAGGAAGIAAAFNTPLAGVMFAIEELARSPEERNSGLLISAIVLAGVIAISVNGNATYFGVIHAPDLELSMLLPGLLVTLAAGVAGGLFSRLLIESLDGKSNDLASLLRQKHPVGFAIACGFAVALIGVVTNGATFGSGYLHTRNMLEGLGHVAVSYVLFKFIATWLTTWSGVPGGIFAPSLAIGAALGHDIALLTHYPHAPVLIALGMVGFLASVTQAPMTSFVIVMEMVDGHTMVLSLMACAFLATTISRLLAPPLYATLSQLQMRRLAALPKPSS
jgi:H+/Cl- antiporter ClcA